MAGSERPEAATTSATPAEAATGQGRNEAAAGREAATAVAQALKPGTLAFDLARNMRYHAAREAWLSFCSRSIKALSLITSAGAVAALLGRLDQPMLAATLAAFVVVLQMVDLVFDLPARARLHATLRQRFASLNSALIGCGDEADRLRTIFQEMVAIYGEEPPAFNVVDAISWNGALRSCRSDISAADLIPITRWQRLTQHLCRRDDFDSRTLREREAARAAAHDRPSA